METAAEDVVVSVGVEDVVVSVGVGVGAGVAEAS
jgi:hypothetical protein